MTNYHYGLKDMAMDTAQSKCYVYMYLDHTYHIYVCAISNKIIWFEREVSNVSVCQLGIWVWSVASMGAVTHCGVIRTYIWISVASQEAVNHYGVI